MAQTHPMNQTVPADVTAYAQSHGQNQRYHLTQRTSNAEDGNASFATCSAEFNTEQSQRSEFGNLNFGMKPFNYDTTNLANLKNLRNFHVNDLSNPINGYCDGSNSRANGFKGTLSQSVTAMPSLRTQRVQLSKNSFERSKFGKIGDRHQRQVEFEEGFPFANVGHSFGMGTDIPQLQVNPRSTDALSISSSPTFSALSEEFGNLGVYDREYQQRQTQRQRFYTSHQGNLSGLDSGTISPLSENYATYKPNRYSNNLSVRLGQNDRVDELGNGGSDTSKFSKSDNLLNYRENVHLSTVNFCGEPEYNNLGVRNVTTLFDYGSKHLKPNSGFEYFASMKDSVSSNDFKVNLDTASFGVADNVLNFSEGLKIDMPAGFGSQTACNDFQSAPDRAKFDLDVKKANANTFRREYSLGKINESELDGRIELEVKEDYGKKLEEKEFGEEEGGEDTGVYKEFQDWLLKNGAEFPNLYLKAYSEDVRGAHCKTYIESYKTVLSIPLQCLITDHMGRTETALGRKLFSSNCTLSTPNLIAVIIYILTTRKDPNHFFQPYYKILPKSYANFPIFWTEEKLKWLQGSPLLEDIAERKRNMRLDYDEICRVCPEFCEFTFEEFLEIRTAVGSRNFGIVVNGEKRTAMVPYADMLNHYRPRETSWTFENGKNAFTITSITPLQPGQQVMDSYGKKCNSKFFLHYGFAVEKNREDDGKCQNELQFKFAITTYPISSKTESFPRKIYKSQSVLNLMQDSETSEYSNSSTASLSEASRNDFDLDVAHAKEMKAILLEKKVAFLSECGAFSMSVNLNGAGAKVYSVSKCFRVSMNIEDRSTAEALSLLRVKVARLDEMNLLFSKGSKSNLYLAGGNCQFKSNQQTNSSASSGDKNPTKLSNQLPLQGISRVRNYINMSPSSFSAYSRTKDSVVPFISEDNEAAMLEKLSYYCCKQLGKYVNTKEANEELLNSGKIAPFSDRRTALVVVLSEQEICHFWINAANILCPILRSKKGRALTLALKMLPRRTDSEKDLYRYGSYLCEEISKKILAS